MTRGTVKFFNYERRYGFVTPHGNGEGVYLPLDAVEAAGIPDLAGGDIVEYDVIEGADRRLRIATIRLISRGAPTSPRFARHAAR